MSEVISRIHQRFKIFFLGEAANFHAPNLEQPICEFLCYRSGSLLGVPWARNLPTKFSLFSSLNFNLAPEQIKSLKNTILIRAQKAEFYQGSISIQHKHALTVTPFALTA